MAEVVRSFRLDDLDLRVSSDSPAVADAVDRLLVSLGFSVSDGGAHANGLVLRLSTATPEDSRPGQPPHPPRADAIRARRDGDAIHLECDYHAIRLDSRAGTGEGVLPPWPSHVREDLLIYGLLVLLAERGYFGLHAAGVMRHGVGYLLVGERGSGKSTHTYSLVRRGWEYLADDAVFLRCRDDRVEALALRRYLYLDPALTKSFPEIAEQGVLDPLAGKRRLVMHEIYPDRGVERCVPRVLLFPEITAARDSRVVPLERTLALPRLLGQSLVFGLDTEAIPRQFDAVSQLAAQAESFRILAGQDLKEDPERVADLLANII